MKLWKMPYAKDDEKKSKTVKCPRCGKKFDVRVDGSKKRSTPPVVSYFVRLGLFLGGSVALIIAVAWLLGGG
jgi:hypothetical protein